MAFFCEFGMATRSSSEIKTSEDPVITVFSSDSRSFGLKRYHFYDDPICNCSIAPGTELFAVQKERNCFPEPSACRRLIASAGCHNGRRYPRCRAGGGVVSQD